MAGPMNNPDGGDRIHDTREVVTRVKFETLSAIVLEVRCLLLGMGNQNPPLSLRKVLAYNVLC